MKMPGMPLLLAVIAFSLVVSSYGQAPEKYTFSTPENCHKYDNDILKYVSWLEHTPPGTNYVKVARSSRFLLDFVSSAPYVKFSPNMHINVYLDDAPQYKLYYMAG